MQTNGPSPRWVFGDEGEPAFAGFGDAAAFLADKHRRTSPSYGEYTSSRWDETHESTAQVSKNLHRESGRRGSA